MMKALILAGGRGTRLKPVTDTMAKHLIPVANRPILFYVLDRIRQAGIREIGMVVSPETGDYIKQAVGNGSRWNVSITYILQRKPLGIAHAVKSARGFLADSPFLLFLGDNLIQGDIRQFVDEFNTYKPDALVLLKEVDNPSAFGVAELDSCGKVRCVVEKPEQPESKMALVGIYIFSSDIHSAIDRIKPSRRGELEITDAIQELLTMNKEIRSNVLSGWWLDTGTIDSILEANRTILFDCARRDIRGNVDSKSKIKGQVKIEPGVEILNSRIEGPVIIAENCHISDSSVGPFVSIGAGTTVDKSCVKNSIIMTGCNISMADELKDSIIGRGSRVLGRSGSHHDTNLFVGENALVQL
jgi:glucose-1-phosphate thymidylyltransferase